MALQHALATSKFLGVLRSAGEAAYKSGRDKQRRVLLQLANSTAFSLLEAAELLAHVKDPGHWSDEDVATFAAAIDSNPQVGEAAAGSDAVKSTKTQDYQNFVYTSCSRTTSPLLGLLSDSPSSHAAVTQEASGLGLPLAK